MPQITGRVAKYPARASFAWYFGLITAGAVLLMQPFCRASSERPISWMDALFTATSAACVTGLTVRSTEHDFSLLGQSIILGLIQLGGIGIMTVTTFIMVQLGRRQGLRARAVITETLGADANTDLRWILSRVFGLTLIVEGIGFVILAIRNLFIDPWPLALWHALFHSVSAFCNAGFALHDDSLTRFQGDPLVNLTICGLIVSGGLGFPVVLNLVRCRHFARGERWMHLSLHSKIMLIGTPLFLLLGCAVFLILEWDGVLMDMPLWKRPLVAFFHSTSCRTAGFNTVEMRSLTNATLFLSILLMAIGAGPCSTGGGFKVSTSMVLVFQAMSTFRGHRRLSLFRRTIPQSLIDRATATAMLFTVVAAAALTILLILEQSAQPHLDDTGIFLDAMFESVSALGTVGLSTGLTTQLTTGGRMVIVVLMFLGRLGPITAFFALSLSHRDGAAVYPDEEPLIG
jgi:trk system potassium uptake protein TrkH